MEPNQIEVKHKSDLILFRLTAIWAFAESGLGGLMHALKLPFTGIFIGGQAVLIVILIAFLADNKPIRIIQALGWVLLIKAAVSPHTPPTAYFAVSFQGLLGMVFSTFLGKNTVLTIVYSVVCMLESALQKIVILTFFGGYDLFTALDKWFLAFQGKNTEKNSFSFSLLLAVGYLSIYLVAGIALGFLGKRLPGLIQTKSQEYLHYFSAHFNMENDKAYIVTKKKKFKWLWLVILFIGILLLYQLNIGEILKIVLRTSLLVLCWFVFVMPLTQYLASLILKRLSPSKKQHLQAYLDYLPEIRKSFFIVKKYVQEQYKGFRIFPEILIGLLVYHTQFYKLEK